MKTKLVAALLAFFLGMFGIHKFYLKQNTAGIIYLVTTLVGWILVIPIIVLSIVVLVDFVMILVMSEEDFNKKYNSTIETTAAVVGSEPVDKVE